MDLDLSFHSLLLITAYIIFIFAVCDVHGNLGLPAIFTKQKQESLLGAGGGRVMSNVNSSHTLSGALDVDVGSCSRQGHRPYQEDEILIHSFLSSSPETHLYCVFDGHAGGRCSKFLSNFYHEILMQDPLFCNNLPFAVKRSFLTANEQFLKQAERMRLHDGSCGLACVLREGKLVIGNVGDCRAVMINRGTAIQLTNDHKPADPDEKKRIGALGGQVIHCMGIARVNGVLAVSRAFGNRALKQVIRADADIFVREFVAGDEYMVIGSDGLWDVLHNREIGDICRKYEQEGANRIGNELVNVALQRGSMDNTTAVVVIVKPYVDKWVHNKSTAASSGATAVASSPADTTFQQALHSSTSGGCSLESQLQEQQLQQIGTPQEMKMRQSARSGGVPSSSGYGYAKNRYDYNGNLASTNRAANSNRPSTTHSNYPPNQPGYGGSIIHSNESDRDLDNEVASFMHQVSNENTQKLRAESRAAAQRPLRLMQHGNHMIQNNNNFRGSPSISPVESPSPLLAATTSTLRRPGTTSNIYNSRHGQIVNGRGGTRGAGLEDRTDKYMNFEEFRQSQSKLSHNSGRSSGYGQSMNRSNTNDLNGGGSYYERGRGGRRSGSNFSRQRW